MKLRASIGSAVLLGLEQALLMEKPTTAYLMLYSELHCTANCMFCPQARESTSKVNQLSRVLWPPFELEEILQGFIDQPHAFQRICIQTVKFRNSTNELFTILEAFQREGISMPISVCSYPLSQKQFEKLKNLSVERVGIAFDCAKPEIFDKIKGKGRGMKVSWSKMNDILNKAMRVFGAENVSTHLIVGLGESEEEAVGFIQSFQNKGITTGLFAFTPVKGTAMENYPQPSIDVYRRIQLAHFCIRKGLTNNSKMKFNSKGKIIDYGIPWKDLLEIISSGKPFVTSGCKGCNRPFYNERPGTELYNYPRLPNDDEISKIKNYFIKFKDQ